MDKITRIRLAFAALAVLALVIGVSATTGAQSSKFETPGIQLVGSAPLAVGLSFNSYSFGLRLTAGTAGAARLPLLVSRNIDTDSARLFGIFAAGKPLEALTVAAGVVGAVPLREIAIKGALMTNYTVQIRSIASGGAVASESVSIDPTEIALPGTPMLGPLQPPPKVVVRTMFVDLVSDAFKGLGSLPREGAIPFENFSVSIDRSGLASSTGTFRASSIVISRAADGASAAIFNLAGKRAVIGQISLVGLASSAGERLIEWRLGEASISEYRQQTQVGVVATEQLSLTARRLEVVEYSADKPGQPVVLVLQP